MNSPLQWMLAGMARDILFVRRGNWEGRAHRNRMLTLECLLLRVISGTTFQPRSLSLSLSSNRNGKTKGLNLSHRPSAQNDPTSFSLSSLLFSRYDFLLIYHHILKRRLLHTRVSHLLWRDLVILVWLSYFYAWIFSCWRKSLFPKPSQHIVLPLIFLLLFLNMFQQGSCQNVITKE